MYRLQILTWSGIVRQTNILWFSFSCSFSVECHCECNACG